jgi:hypothetical protein
MAKMAHNFFHSKYFSKVDEKSSKKIDDTSSQQKKLAKAPICYMLPKIKIERKYCEWVFSGTRKN